MKLNNPFKRFGIVIVCLSTLSISTFANEAETTLKSGRIKFKQQDIKFQMGGRLQFDHDRFDGVHNKGKSGSATEIRRARIFIKSTLGEGWESKLQLEFNDQTRQTRLQDAYIKYKGWEWANLTIGKTKEPFGLEVLNSNKHINFIERSMASIIFGPSRSYGLKLFGQGGNATYAAGVFLEDQDEERQETYAWTGRVTYAPSLTDNVFIHLGLAGSRRDKAGKDYQIKTYSEVHSAEKIVTSGVTNQVDNITILGLEAAAVYGSFSLQTEYMKTAIESNSADNADYNGYYVQADYFLTGESRSYKNGHFDKVKPRSPSGAWQLVARLSHIDTYDNNDGLEIENITLGINYYANQHVRISANYIMTEVDDFVPVLNENDGDALSLRFQYVF